MSLSETQLNQIYNEFIEAAEKVIEREGVHQITVRKVAEQAGYTPSTIYNYFDEFSHLVFFASLRFMKDYNEELDAYIAKSDKPVERYLLAWECFCKYSFEKPDIFNIIFLSDLGANPNTLIERYYTFYTKELAPLPDYVKIIVLENDLYERNKLLIYAAAACSGLDRERVEIMLSSTILVWKGMLISVINNRITFSPKETAAMTMDYIRKLTEEFLGIDKNNQPD